MMNELLQYMQAHLDEIRADLSRLVELESPSDDPHALERCSAFIADRARELTGSPVRTIHQENGPHLDILIGQHDVPRVLVLGHFDTVWPIGTLAERPYSDDGHIARGPGVFDMKAGLIQGLWAVQALRVVLKQSPSVRLLFNSDEEIQSVHSRPLIEAAAREVRTVLVLEPSLDGALKTARKGVGRFQISIRGRAAHAGVDPQTGRSAIAELARVIEYLHSLTDPNLGTVVNVGVVSGGTRANVIAAEAHAIVDVRVVNLAEADRISRLVLALHPSRDGIAIDVTGQITRPPMQRTPDVGKLFVLAQRLGQRIGCDITEAATGGGSDGNFCAALGIPVLDGLGAVGGGAHSIDEYVSIDCMPSRAALTAGLIAACSAEKIADDAL
jgi:glutamate carboxypeptidase